MKMNDNEVIRLLLVGGNEAMREELSQMLDGGEGIAVIGKTKSGEDARTGVRKLYSDVVIMLTDTSITGKKIIDAISVLGETHLPARVILMTDQPIRYLGMAIKAGVAGLLPKATSPDALVAAIRKIYLWSQATDSPQGITS